MGHRCKRLQLASTWQRHLLTHLLTLSGTTLSDDFSRPAPHTGGANNFF